MWSNRRRWTAADVKRLMQLRDAGLSQKEIGYRLGRTTYAVNSRLQYMNVEKREKKFEQRKAKTQQPPLPDNIVEGIDEQPSYWRDAAAANHAFLELLHLHHPEKAPDTYNGDLDFGASINACYDAVKARIAAGGEPWIPKP